MAEDVSGLLAAWSQGDQSALDRLVPVVYEELRRLAGHYMTRERPGHSLQAKALVNEAYLRLTSYSRMQWQGRAHFFAVAGQAMRRILVDYARSHQYLKRGAGVPPMSLDDAVDVSDDRAWDFVALDDALTDLAAIDPRKSQVVELRFFGGLSVEETAEVLRISVPTVMRDWNVAKAWLYRELGDASQT